MSNRVNGLSEGMIVCMLAGCGGDTRSADKVSVQNTVDKIIQEQIDNAQDEPEDMTEEISEADTELTEEVISEEETEGTGDIVNSGDLAIDYDLTTMSSDMVYATVYRFMVYPSQYEGCKVRIKGNYYATFYEPTQKYYHYVVIQDALACCAQGMEFIWEDGSHVYPDEYPADQAEIEVTGTFMTYREEGDDNLYCALKDAELKVLADNVQ